MEFALVMIFAVLFFGHQGYDHRDDLKEINKTLQRIATALERSRNG